jgi:hypothetical protein
MRPAATATIVHMARNLSANIMKVLPCLGGGLFWRGSVELHSPCALRSGGLGGGIESRKVDNGRD